MILDTRTCVWYHAKHGCQVTPEDGGLEPQPTLRPVPWDLKPGRHLDVSSSHVAGVPRPRGDQPLGLGLCRPLWITGLDPAPGVIFVELVGLISHPTYPPPQPSEPTEEEIEARDGWRLYLLLALFDARDGTTLSALVQKAREGYERSAPGMDEDDAWAPFDSLWDSFDSAERLALAPAALRAKAGR